MQFDAMVLCSFIPIYPHFFCAILDESVVRYQTKPGRHDVRVHLLDVVDLLLLLLLDSSKTPTDPSRFAISKSFSNAASFGKR
jgi:hypothetical protein